MGQQLDRHRVAHVRHAIGTAGRRTGPQFERAPVKRACPHTALRCGREPGPDARAFLVLRVGISDAAPFDPHGPERFCSDCAQGLGRKLPAVLNEAGADRTVWQCRARRNFGCLAAASSDERRDNRGGYGRVGTAGLGAIACRHRAAYQRREVGRNRSRRADTAKSAIAAEICDKRFHFAATAK